ncbi:MAG: hypothetical protein JWL83_3215 [Actinomycetia bacterium]|jgi:hypothetical protein|nr:hypothetical protein [Actinomycetes bacterium]
MNRGHFEDAVEVRHVQPYEAVKAYRCPGCNHEIRAREGHEVVVPVDAPDLRRHWHTACWRIEQRRTQGKRPRG